MAAAKKGGGGAKVFGQKRKSADVIGEKYSPIKESRDEHSLEDEKDAGKNNGSDEDQYTSMDNSESTLKHKYSNATAAM